jgi:hypothetical protein
MPARPRPAAHHHFPCLEALEDRRLPSVSATGSGVFIRYRDGQLWEHAGSTFTPIAVNTMAVSAGKDTNGSPAAFILFDSGILDEWSATLGFIPIDGNVAAVSASQQERDTAFILYTNGRVFEHQGTSLSQGFTAIDSNAIQVSAGTDQAGHASVFIVYNNHALFQWSAASGFRRIDVNVLNVSAVPTTQVDGQSSLVGADTAFITYQNSMLFEWSAAAGFQFIDSNVLQVSVTETAPPPGGGPFIVFPTVFILYNNHQVFEWMQGGAPTPFTLIDSNVVALSSTSLGFDDVFLVYNTSALFENNHGHFTFIDVNVGP